MGGTDDADPLACSAPTAKTLGARSVFVDPHLGHSIFCRPFMLRTSFSNFVSHFLQVYS